MTGLAVIDQPLIGNIDAEMGVIGAALYQPTCIDRLADVLTPDQFADPFLGFVYGTILREHGLGRSLSPLTIKSFLEGEPAFGQLGGTRWLAGLGNPAAIIGALENARQIAEMARRRKLVEGLRETIIRAADYEQSVDELVSAADEAIGLARDAGQGASEFSGAECLDAVIEGFDAPLEGVTCGNIPALDELLGPFRPGHLVIGAGRPGMGKTATAISYALGAAAQGDGVLFVSLEMEAKELGERMAADLCLEHRIPYEAIRDRRLNANQKREICRARARLEEMPLQIIDKAGVSTAQLRAMVRRWSRRFAARGKTLRLVIVDYLQLMRGTGKDRYEQITQISQALKEIAKENGVAVFALAQLSREVEKRADKRPILADLRDSGSIEQDADTILFLLRDEYYLRSAEPHPNDPKREGWEQSLARCQGRIEFICAKRRAGSTGSRTGDFLYHYQAVRG